MVKAFCYCGGDFLFPACYCFLLQIHDPAYFIFCQLTDQAIQGRLVGKLSTFFCAAAGKNRNLPEGELFLHGLHTTAVVVDSISCLQYLPFLPGEFIKGFPHRLNQTVIGDNTAQISNTVRDDLFYNCGIILVPVNDGLRLPGPDADSFCHILVLIDPNKPGALDGAYFEEQENQAPDAPFLP